MGAIYIGKKLGPGGFEKEVVLKQLLPEYTSRPEFRDLFFREAKISATLDHANIVHTFDLVESDQSLFIVMEYVRGADLRTIVRRARHRRRSLSPAAAIHIALEILAGLAYAHTRRDSSGKSLDIIHRDVSPSNIICSAQGEAKLSDFGIAKASTYSSVFYRVRGKVGYMSPEQARSQAIDHRCDLFSLSVCLYEALSGERLFVGDLNTPADEIYGHPILPASKKRAGLPAALDAVLARALAPNVDDRYQTAVELAEALGNVAHRKGLAFSAPELAAHLRDILGDDPDRWLRDEPAVAISAPQPVPAGGSDLVGTEASSIGIVSDVPGDEQARAVLSPKAVTGGKDFDIDSMLSDEATLPGGERRGDFVPSPSATAKVDRAGAGRADDGRVRLPGATAKPDDGRARLPGSVAKPDDGRVRVPGTPPPVWTRNSAPFSVVTPQVLPTASMPPMVPAPRPAIPGGRPLPRATLRTTAVPPPFSPAGRASPPPPPPPFPHGSADVRMPPPPNDEIEDATPPPPRFAEAFPINVPAPTSFDIEDALAPLGDTEPSEVPVPAPIFRPLPPAPYPAPEADPPLVLNRPQTMDFSGAVSALLPEKRGGPSAWLAALLIVASAVGGAALADRATRATVVVLTTADRSTPLAKDRVAAPTAPVAPAAPTPTVVEAATKAAAPAPRPNAEVEADHEAPPPTADPADGKAAVSAESQPAKLHVFSGKHHPSHLKKNHRRKH